MTIIGNKLHTVCIIYYFVFYCIFLAYSNVSAGILAIMATPDLMD